MLALRGKAGRARGRNMTFLDRFMMAGALVAGCAHGPSREWKNRHLVRGESGMDAAAGFGGDMVS